MNKNEIFFDADGIEIFPEDIVVKSTNFFDKNGIEIFDGDTIEIEKSDGDYLRGKVEWSTLRNCWIIIDDNKDYDCTLDKFIVDKCEVV